jgi:hypothetical protein
MSQTVKIVLFIIACIACLFIGSSIDLHSGEKLSVLRKQADASCATVLVELLHPRAQLEQLYMNAALAVSRELPEEMPPQIWDMLEVNVDVTVLNTQLAAAYRAILTDEDICALVAFYQSGPGQRGIHATLVINAAINRTLEGVYSQLVVEIRKSIENIVTSLVEQMQQSETQGKELIDTDVQ